MHNFFSIALAALLATLIPSTFAHSWPEELQVIGPNGSYIGDRGYMRGYIARTDPTFDGDLNVLWLLPPLDARMPDDSVRLFINSSDYLCRPSQRTSNYSNPAYPKLKVSAGGHVAIKYLENGHVTLPWNQPGKPSLGGTVFVYGTRNPSTTEKIADVLQWTANGTGGDGRGYLLAAQTFDDGRCHQINNCRNSAMRQALYPNNIPNQPTAPPQEQWCETDLAIPSNEALGDLTLYWVWQWPTSPNVDCVVPTGKDEYYTSCIDVEIVDGGPGDINIINEYAGNTLVQEDYQTKAVSDYKSRIALTASPSYTLANWYGLDANHTVTPAASFVSSCVPVISSMEANAAVAPPSCLSGLWATGELFASITNSVKESRNTAIFLAEDVTETFPPRTQAFIVYPTAAPSAAVTSSGPRPTKTVDATVLSTSTVTTVVSVPVSSSGAPPSPSGIERSASGAAPIPSGSPAPAPSGSLPVPSAAPAAPSGSPPVPSNAPPAASGAPPAPSGSPPSGAPSPPSAAPSPPSAAPLPSSGVPTPPSAASSPPSGAPSPPSGAPPVPSAAPPSGSPSPPSAAPPAPSGSPQPSNEPVFNTISTVSRAPVPSAAPSEAADVALGKDGKVIEHLAGHRRRHARHFA